jgi:hypothetical protein
MPNGRLHPLDSSIGKPIGFAFLFKTVSGFTSLLGIARFGGRLGSWFRLPGRAGDAHAHQQKTKALAQGVEHAHRSIPF